MTKAEQFEALALRCEQATGPDRELDLVVWSLCVPGVTRKHTSYFHKASGSEYVIDETRDATGRLIIVPAYSASLDAALTLVPVKSMWSVCDMEEGPFAQVIRPMPDGGYVGGLTSSHGRAPAPALCAAALRARAQMERGK